VALAKKRKCRQILVWSSMSVQIGGEILKPKMEEILIEETIGVS
jgi:hypothetical protein